MAIFAIFQYWIVCNELVNTFTRLISCLQVSYREDTSDEWHKATVGNSAILSNTGDVREFLLTELSSNTVYYLNVSLFNTVFNTNRAGPFISVGPFSTNNSGMHSEV